MSKILEWNDSISWELINWNGIKEDLDLLMYFDHKVNVFTTAEQQNQFLEKIKVWKKLWQLKEELEIFKKTEKEIIVYLDENWYINKKIKQNKVIFRIQKFGDALKEDRIPKFIGSNILKLLDKSYASIKLLNLKGNEFFINISITKKDNSEEYFISNITFTRTKEK